MSIAWYVVMKKILLFLLRFYEQFISPLKPTPTCIYTPCCSEYARQAIIKYGAFKGGFLALKRILRCHPFQKGCYDPVT